MGLILLLLVYGCKDQDEDIDLSKNETIELFHWEEGQVLTYVAFVAENYSHEDSTGFNYTGDTIRVTIIKVENDRYTFLHEPTSYSRSWSDSTLFSGLFQDSDLFTRNYTLYVEENSLRQEATSERFNLLTWGSTSYTDLPLYTFQGQATTVTGWRPDLPYTESYQKAYLLNHALLGRTYDTLNVVVDNASMAVDGNGRTMIYSNTHGIVMSSWYSWWSGWVWGLHLVPEEAR